MGRPRGDRKDRAQAARQRADHAQDLHDLTLMELAGWKPATTSERGMRNEANVG